MFLSMMMANLTTALIFFSSFLLFSFSPLSLSLSHALDFPRFRFILPACGSSGKALSFSFFFWKMCGKQISSRGKKS